MSVSPTADFSPFETENFLEIAMVELIEGSNIEFEGNNLDIEVNFTVGEWNETKGIKNEIKVRISNSSWGVNTGFGNQGRNVSGGFKSRFEVWLESKVASIDISRGSIEESVTIAYAKSSLDIDGDDVQNRETYIEKSHSMRIVVVLFLEVSWAMFVGEIQ